MTNDGIDDLDDLRRSGLMDFDAATHRLYVDGLLSERTMMWLWEVSHRETQEMMELKRLEEESL